MRDYSTEMARRSSFGATVVGAAEVDLKINSEECGVYYIIGKEKCCTFVSHYFPPYSGISKRSFET